jgi:ParB family transcriptional regulator, chromosome partitioning protein
VHGVLEPIIVRPKNADGKHLIVFGERRYRASLMAGKNDIPVEIRDTAALLEEDVRFVQLAENIQRDDLDPLEIASMIKELLDSGMKKAHIAAKLGQSASYVSEHVALAEGPEFIRDLAARRVAGLRTLYDLVQAHKEFPSEVETYATATEEITRAAVAELIQRLKAPQKQRGEGAGQQQTSGVRTRLVRNRGGGSEQQGQESQAANAGDGKADNKVTEPTQSENGGQATTRLEALALKPIKELAVVVRVGDRVATIARRGKVEAIFKDTGEVAEINLATVEIVGTEVIEKESVESVS